MIRQSGYNYRYAGGAYLLTGAIPLEFLYLYNGWNSTNNGKVFAINLQGKSD